MGLHPDNGNQQTIGNYPGGPRYDSQRTPTHSHSFYITQLEADAIILAIRQPGYDYNEDNCVDRVEDALDIGNIDHPNFDTFGISDPTQLDSWLEALNWGGVELF